MRCGPDWEWWQIFTSELSFAAAARATLLDSLSVSSPPLYFHPITMSSTAPVFARQALRQCSRRLSTTSQPFAKQLPRACIAAKSRRTYVSESAPKNATVNIEQTIKEDQKAFLAETEGCLYL
jgi:hypothetical protein